MLFSMFEDVIAALEEKRSRIDAVLLILKDRRRGRPPAALSGLLGAIPKKRATKSKPKRVVSAAVRQRMSAAQKKRWREQRATVPAGGG